LEPACNMLIVVFESIVCEFCRRIVSQMRDLPGHARGYGNTRRFLTHPKVNNCMHLKFIAEVLQAISNIAEDW
jgi:hypothetical protein